ARAPDGERLADPLARLDIRGISIHAPRMGSDPPVNCGGVPVVTFQSTLPVCFVKFLWAVSAFLLVRLSGCF
ncbi:hypothetical protein LIP81_19110, partial [Erysipelatoclostridium ramosum]|nr:hypothetical protein [Thomasclavelia ramosa]